MDRGRLRTLLLLIAQLAVAAHAGEWSTATHRLFAADFNADDRADLLVIARDPWSSSGLILGDSTGQPSILHQFWRSDHLGIDWSGDRLQPVIGSFSDARCTAGHMGSSCVYPDDVLLQAIAGGPQALLFTDHQSVTLDRIQQRIPGTHLGLDWSGQQHRLLSGYFNNDNYHDLFLQSVSAEGMNAVVINTTQTGFDDDSQPLQTWPRRWAGFDWSLEDAEVHRGDFTGDGIDDLLVQGRTPAGDPYAPGLYGIVAGQGAGGFAGNDGAEPEAYLRWTREALGVPDWSPDNYRLLVGNFNNDRYDDVLLQPRHAGNAGYIVLFGPRDQISSWVVARIPDGASGLDWSQAAAELLIADFDGDFRDDIYYQSTDPAGSQNQILALGALSGGKDVSLTLRPSAALALDEIPDNASPVSGTAVGAISGQFEVDPTGAAVYRLPLRVPPGVNGLQPDIALTYNHRAGADLIADGWSLSGLAVIRRCAAIADPQADGIADGVDFDALDRFCLDGARLIETSRPGEYRTEIDTLRRIRAVGREGNGPAGFSVADKTGLTWEFGLTSDSRIHPRSEQESEDVLVYAVSRVTDRYGNTIQYSWSQDSSSSAYRPDRIAWTNSAGQVLGRLQFHYEQRIDRQSGWLQGYRIEQPWRLRRIETFVRALSGADTPVTAYHLQYDYNQISGRSHLAALLECEQTTGSCLGATRFTSEPGQRGFSVALSTAVQESSRKGLQLLDVNNNGIPDHVYLRQIGDAQYRWTVRFDAADGLVGAGSPLAVDWDQAIVAPVGFRALSLDLNGDGHADLLQPSGDEDNSGTVLQWLEGSASGFKARSTTLSTRGRQFRVAGVAADVNGDGRDDLATSHDGVVQVFLSTGTDFSPIPLEAPIPGQLPYRTVVGETGRALQPIRFDADGRSDLLALTADCEQVPYAGIVCSRYQWLVYSYADHQSADLTVVYEFPEGDFMRYLRVLDANGDGLSDLLFWHGQAQRWELHEGTGTGFHLRWSASTMQLPVQDDSTREPGRFGPAPPGWDRRVQATIELTPSLLQHASVIDYDHDGRDDLLVHRPGETDLDVLILNADTGGPDAGLVRTGVAAPNFAYRDRVVVGDLGGDGIPDLFFPDAFGRYQIFHGRGPKPGALLQIEDGLGARTQIRYGVTTDPDVYQGSRSLDGETGIATFPYRNYAGPISVVRESGTPSGLGPDVFVSTEYLYAGAKLHVQGRGFLGFSELRASNRNRGITTINRFAQRFPFTGMVSASEQRFPTDAAGGGLTTVEIPGLGSFGYPAVCDTNPAHPDCQAFVNPGVNSSAAISAGRLVSSSRSSFVAPVTAVGAAGQSYLPLTASTTEVSYPVMTTSGVGATAYRRVVTTYHSSEYPVDGYGNSSRITVTVDDGSLGDVHTTTTDNYWEQREADWCLSLLRRSTVSSRAPGVPVVTRVRAFTFDANCSIASDTSQPDSTDARLVRTYSYDGHGNRTHETISGANFVTRTTHREFSSVYGGRFATKAVNALGQATLSDWDPRFGAETSRQGPGSGPLLQRYDGFGRLLAARGPQPGLVREILRAGCFSVSCRGPDAVFRQTVLASDGQEETTEYDRAGRVVHSSRLGFDGERIDIDRRYDTLGREYAVSMPYRDGNSGRRCYVLRKFDALNRLIMQLEPLQALECADTPPVAGDWQPGLTGRVTRLTHDLPDALGIARRAVTEFPDSDGGLMRRVRLEVRDVMDRPVRVTEGDGENSATNQYSYFADGNLRELIDPEGQVSRYSYDVYGRPLTVQDASAGLAVYGYNSLGEKQFSRDANGRFTAFEYDVLGRLTRRIWNWNYLDPQNPDQQITEWHYDGAAAGGSRLSKAIGPYRLGDGAASAELEISYRYDDAGQLVHTVRHLREEGDERYYWTSQAFDDQGRLSLLSYPSSAEDASSDFPGSARLVLRYEHGPRGFLRRAVNAATGHVYWEARGVDVFGHFSAFAQDAGKVSSTRQYDGASGLLTGTSTLREGSIVQHLLFDWTGAGDLARREDRLHDYAEDYGYDELGRLTDQRISVDSQQIAAHRFNYSPSGNLLERGDRAAVFEYDAARKQSLIGMRSADGVERYQYDAAGSSILRKGNPVDWTPDHLPSVIRSGALQLAFAYGPQRQRYRQDYQRPDGDGSIWYLGTATKREVTAGQSALFRYQILIGREPVAEVTRWANGTERTEYLHHDQLGSVTAVSSSSAVTRVAYDLWGRAFDPASMGNSAGDLLVSIAPLASSSGPGFTGQETLAGSGLIHFNGRVLDTELGRFLSADPYVQFPLATQGMNRYAYALNRPRSLVDPSGYGLGNFLLRLGKRLFFAAPFLIAGQGTGGLFGDTIGLSIGFSVSGFLQTSGAMTAALPRIPSFGGPARPDLTAGSRNSMILSAQQATSALRGSMTEYTRLRLQIGLQGGQLGLQTGTQGVDRSGPLDPNFVPAVAIGSVVGPPPDSALEREPGRIYITAHRIGLLGPLHTAIEYRDEAAAWWVSAGPEGWSLEGYQALVGGVGTATNGVRETDSPAGNAVLAEVQPPPGMSASAYFARIRTAAAAYCNCADYDLFPGITGGYNSNGYVGGLIEATGGQTTLDFNDLVGGGRPVPPEYFGY